MVQISHIHRCTDFLFMLLNNSSFFPLGQRNYLSLTLRKQLWKITVKCGMRGILYILQSSLLIWNSSNFQIPLWESERCSSQFLINSGNYEFMHQKKYIFIFFIYIHNCSRSHSGASRPRLKLIMNTFHPAWEN